MDTFLSTPIFSEDEREADANLVNEGFCILVIVFELICKLNNIHLQ